MVSLTIEGESLSAVLTQLKQAVYATDVPPTGMSPVGSKAEKAPKEKKEETAKAEASQDTSKAAPGQASFLAVAEIIPKVVAKAGKPKAVELLAKYGAKKGGELKPEQYGSFLGDCKTVLGE